MAEDEIIELTTLKMEVLADVESDSPEKESNLKRWPTQLEEEMHAESEHGTVLMYHRYS